MPFLPIVAAGVSAAVGAKSLLSGNDGPAAGGATLAPIMTPFGTKENPEGLKKNLQEDRTKATGGIDQYQDFVNAVNAQNGLGNQSQVYGQLQDVAAGTGPNPAQAQLANATGANVANQAALMAGQRGTSANTGLIARQAAQQGASIQQNAAGQGAALQAQQSLGALGAAGNIANQQAGQQGQAVAGYNTVLQNQQGQTLGAINDLNKVNVANASQVNSPNAQMQVEQSKQNANQMGNILNAAGTIAGKLGTGSSPTPQPNINQGGTPIGQTMTPGMADGGTITGPKSRIGQHFANGGKVPALVSPGERYLAPDDVRAVADGKKSALGAGEKIPGNPKVGGSKNSYANDTVEKTLETGGVVLPRSVTQAENPGDAAAKFVQAILARKGRRK